MASTTKTTTRVKRMAMFSRFRGGVVVAAVVGLTGCGKAGHSNGEVSRTWSPPVHDTVLGVPATAAHSAIQARLAASPPAPLTKENWKHVRALYAAFGQSLLWL